MSSTQLEKWSVRFGIIFVGTSVLSLIIALAIGGDAAVVENNTVLLMLTIILNTILNLTGLLSLVVGIVAIVKYKRWLVAKYLAILYSLAIVLFLLGEFLFPQ